MNIPLSKIKPNNWNPNVMTPEEYAELVAEIKHLGRPPKPIVLRTREHIYEIVDGEHCYKALVENGYTELKEGWYELVVADDTEAMRQTYKRNQHGKHDPIKQGLMFQRVLKETGLSNRDLAKKWELSEGTVRNSLLYAEVAQLRNDYADVAKLSVEQVRIYSKLCTYSKKFADLWLSSGAYKDALIWWNDNSYDEESKAFYRQQDIVDDVGTFFKDLTDAGMEEFIYPPSTISGLPEYKNSDIARFKNDIKKLDKAMRFKRQLTDRFTYGMNDEDLEGRRTAKELIEAYFRHPNGYFNDKSKTTANGIVEAVISIHDNKRVFALTPAELEESLEIKPGEYYQSALDKVRLFIAKKLEIAPSEVKISTSWNFEDTVENELADLELQKVAPTWLKEAKLPAKLKLKFWNFFKDKDESVTRDLFTWIENKPHYVMQLKEQELNDLFIRRLKQYEQQKKIDDLSKQPKEVLAGYFFEKVKNAIQVDERIKKEYISKLSENFNKDFIYLLVYLSEKYLQEQEYRQMIESMVGKLNKLKK